MLNSQNKNGQTDFKCSIPLSQPLPLPSGEPTFPQLPTWPLTAGWFLSQCVILFVYVPASKFQPYCFPSFKILSIFFKDPKGLFMQHLNFYLLLLWSRK